MTAQVLPAQVLPGGAAARATASTDRARTVLRLRISDHAIDHRFYGVIAAEWPDLDRAAGAPERIVWEDRRCHRERGLPKLAVVDIARHPEDGAAPTLAQMRQRGQRLPADEIVERKVVEPLAPPAVLTIDAETRVSGLRIRLTLYAAACRIGAGSAAAPVLH
ncbi:hypothetical protein PQJ75_29695 [Rhodoplanes sp. TEM]|uniref:Uncharacterized protein n=1 Tax=Rhodoplanes tepidamans TaxID=200616 RepID=A0ABT5JIJ7_RHOTP|nr:MULTISPECIES: hypothetical protein [Rhodoplanes]MDC7789520.1 hypothetical protein [Rhodoplanes tepidamans]MDC7987928.1 hypothetical protein [Rhodoplanes sp. TEM]MDQ0359103.1 hypothetical protein [Rhodoplanes tepidamans]